MGKCIHADLDIVSKLNVLVILLFVMSAFADGTTLPPPYNAEPDCGNGRTNDFRCWTFMKQLELARTTLELCPPCLGMGDCKGFTDDEPMLTALSLVLRKISGDDCEKNKDLDPNISTLQQAFQGIRPQKSRNPPAKNRLDKFYETLGVARTADDKAVRRAFLALANQHHPDKGGDEEVFKLVTQAYECISDKSGRGTCAATGA